MELVEESNVRARKDKTYHVVISFHPNDRRVQDAELAEIVRKTVAAVGLDEHQYIAVRHSDQEHEHLHIAVNKIHPETQKIHHPFRDIPQFKLLAGELEKQFGLHQVDRGVTRMETDRARDYEAQRGIESFSRWARRTIGGAIELDGIASWQALHEELTRFGVRLVRRGNGLAVVDATRPTLACKASALGRGWSKQRLSQRYGEFVRGPSPAEVAREHVEAYAERPLEQLRDDGLWREYQDALAAARTRSTEQREALSVKIDDARGAHRRHFKMRHHAIAAMPISGHEKRKLYKMLSFERKTAERKLRATTKQWRAARVAGHPGSWKEFLAERAAGGDPRAMRRLRRQWRGLEITTCSKRSQALRSRKSRTSRGNIVHNLPGGVRLRESAGSIELLGEARDDALEQLAKVAKQRFGSERVALLGRKDVQRRLAEIAAERGLEIAEERQR
ncbi:MAG: relaxase/mobilization nuclease domain-containing protein [Myxococcales bacterium]|nr:relaxase/mobilization nuclease domain-containing protein [Myxococcales bacterium]